MIGERIRQKRIELGITQDELAHRLGYKSRTTINKIEAGVNDITQSKVVEFARALNTTAADLMGWVSDDPVVNDIAAAILEHDDKPTEEEMELVRAYRSADELTKQMVLRLLKV